MINGNKKNFKIATDEFHQKLGILRPTCYKFQVAGYTLYMLISTHLPIMIEDFCTSHLQMG